MAAGDVDGGVDHSSAVVITIVRARIASVVAARLSSPVPAVTDTAPVMWVKLSEVDSRSQHSFQYWIDFDFAPAGSRFRLQ